jgi:hypothetical protein
MLMNGCNNSLHYAKRGLRNEVPLFYLSCPDQFYTSIHSPGAGMMAVKFCVAIAAANASLVR